MRQISLVRSLLALVLALTGTGATYAYDGSPHSPGLSEAARAGGLAPVGGPSSRTGWLHMLYGDAAPGGSPTATSGFVLIDDHGKVNELLVSEDALRTAGGRRALNGRYVTIDGQPLAPAQAAGPAGPMPLVGVHALQLTASQADELTMQAAVTGAQPWATVLCRFADEPDLTPKSKAWFDTLMLGSASAPSLGHYWREVSYGNVNLTGSVVVGWYTLPQPRSYYVYGNPVQLDFQRAANDCTGVADADVYFPDFVGINLAFNENLDGYAWGGSWTITRDGRTKTYRMTWLPPWGYENQAPVAHEMGHGFGLPHSSGPYSQTYDSAWDVMSGLWYDCPPYDPDYGCVGTHTISYHKDILGWIPTAQKYVAADGTSQTITLERLALPTTTNYLMAQINIGSSATNFYTVEVRRLVGYDATLPGDAVIIHKVDTTRSDRDAQVVDPDGNGDPNDGGAMWLPGDSFFDSPNGIGVSVIGQTATGFQVAVSKGGASYVLSVTVSGTGTVTSSPAGINCSAGTCSASFPANTSVTLTPSGGTLSVWGGACSGSGTCVVSMTATQAVTAAFATPTYSLTISPVPSNGGVSGPGISCGAGTLNDCAESFVSGTSVVLTASPASGYAVGVWTGCQSVSGTQCTVQMTQARTVTVTFDQAFYALTVSPVPTQGAISGFGISCGVGTINDCAESLPSGSGVVLTASPAAGYAVGAWTGCQSVSGTQCTVQMAQARTVAVTFNQVFYALTVSPAPTQGAISGPGISCGAGTINDCAESLASGSIVVLTASPAAGYAVGAWTGCQSVSGTQCTVQMTQARTVAVTFDQGLYALTVSPVPTGGAVSGPGITCGAGTINDCAESLASGSIVVLTASPAAGYTLGAWSGCQSVSGTQCTVQMTQARTVAVTFTPTYTLTVSPVPTGGSITGAGISCGASTIGDCSESVAIGTSVVLTASPATGYQFSGWSGCQSVSGTQCTVSMTQARTVSATFTAVLYKLQVSAPNHGNITGPGISCGTGTLGDCTELVLAGTSVVLAGTPADGYQFSAWSGCQSVSGTQCTVSMTQARTVSATFTAVLYKLQVSAPNHGSITGPGISCGTGTLGDCTELVLAGTSVVLAATPADGYQFSAWSGCQSVSGAQCTVLMTQARNVSATFTRITYTLTVSPIPVQGKVTATGISCGTGTNNDCTNTVNSGTSVTLNASPASGYQLGAWSGCQSVSGTKCTVQMTQPRTVSVTFNPITR
jgi:M6 family metalloprotease-like protein